MNARASRGATEVAGAGLIVRRIPYLLLLIFFAVGMTQVVRASITFDEGPHLAVGYATLRTRDFRLQPVHIHPPLANVLAAAPLLLQRDLPNPAQISDWDINSLSAVTDAVVWQYPYPRRMAVAGRVPILLLATLLGALVMRWGTEVAGRGGGLLALTLYALDPNISAHGALATTDTAATFFTVATLYSVYRVIRLALRPDPAPHRVTRQLVLSGVLLGLAQLAKVSALLLVPVVGALLLATAWTEGGPRVWKRVARWSVILLACAALTVWIGYGFEIGSVEGWPTPLPAATHIQIFQSLRQHYELGHPTFAAGRISDQGWWWYFPLAFALKTPLPVLVMLAVALAVGIRRWLLKLRYQPATRCQVVTPARLALALFPALYAGTALFSTVNIGYRHLLPLLPFLYIGIGVASSRLRRSSLLTLATLGLIAWIGVGTLRTLPYPLTFFNEIAGGPEGGYRYLVDSNLDWGQNLWDLKAWLDAHPETPVSYAHYSPARLEAYDIHAEYLPPDPRAVTFTPWDPEPGTYAIGATVLQGAYAPDINTYAWFRGRAPTGRLGNALFLYVVPRTPSPSWVALCGDQVTSEAVLRYLGNASIRVIRPQCDQTLIYPAAEAPGLYVLPATMPPPSDGQPWVALRDQEGHTVSRAFRVDRSSVMPANPADGHRIEGPLSFVGHSAFITTEGKNVATSTAGDIADHVRPGSHIRVQTYWEVTSVPARPLSLMAHLVSGGGDTVAVGDGLGFPIEQWQIGDLIVQDHVLTVPETLAPGTELTVQIGAYWLDTMERWPVDGDSQSLPVATLTVSVR
ncbi:MAG: phospholipid carrier-dependent glycosyltransferase [Anaerolineae bacterium]